MFQDFFVRAGFFTRMSGVNVLHFRNASCNTCTLLFEYFTQIYPKEITAFKDMAENYAKDKEAFTHLFQSMEWIRRVTKKTFTNQTSQMRSVMTKTLLSLVHTFEQAGPEFVCFIFSSGCFQSFKHALFSLR